MCTISGVAFREKHGQTCIGDDVKSPRNFSGVDVCETRACYMVYINIFLLLSRVFFFYNDVCTSRARRQRSVITCSIVW